MIQSNEHIFVFFAVVIALALLHTVNGQYTPAYLQTNMVENDTNKNTFRVIHEQTAAMAFEWNPMTHENFGYVYLVQEVKYWTDTTAKVGEGNIGLLEAIGKPCEASNYRAEGHSKNFFNSNFQTYHMTYKRVPRIKNVQIQFLLNMYTYVSWETERSACESTDSVIVFRGYSSEPLQMSIISSDQVEYNMNDFKATEGMEGVFILFNKHGNHFSLPTMDKKQVGKVNNERPTIRTKPTQLNHSGLGIDLLTNHISAPQIFLTISPLNIDSHRKSHIRHYKKISVLLMFS
uniref:Pur_ac_phosph_N domain-containing protein n=1 Tax=Schistosoma mansoni TaxID=6183 RepID=A0A5K4FA13_SCHMA